MEGASRQSLAEARARLDALVSPPPPERAGGPARRAPRVDLDRVAEQLFGVSTLLRRELGLRRALADPGTPPASRQHLLERVVGGRLSGPSLDLLRAVVTSRWSRPLDLQQAVEALGVEALLARAQTEGSLDEVEDELFRFGRIVDREPGLALALTDPALPAERKRALLERLLADRARPVTRRLIERAVGDGYRHDLERTIEEFTQLAAARRQRLVAVVRVARPLDDEQAARLREAISRYFGRDIQLQVDVDPTVLGGVVVRVGDEVVDGSVARRLAGVRRRLLR